MKLLITGSNGFLGSHLCDIACQEGHEVFAAIRSGANTDLIDHLAVKKVILDYANEIHLQEQLSQLVQKYGQFDCILHNAGITNTSKKELFFKFNTELTDALIHSVKESKALSSSGRFAYISSLAAIGPKGSNGPVSSYGHSKAAAESAISESGLAHLIFRPGGIYGSGDQAFLPLFKTVKMGIYPCMPPKNQKMALIHGVDAASNVIKILARYDRGTFHIADQSYYSHVDFKDAVDQGFGRTSIMMNIPKGVVSRIIGLMEKVTTLFDIEPTITQEKFNEVAGDWDIDIPHEQKTFTMKYQYSLVSGILNTIEDYKRRGWL